MGNDYKNTLNLPKTDFPMKADLAKREPAIQQEWKENHLYEQIQAQPHPKGDYILHDGPPYSNGPIHMGTALNKILKDFIIKYRTMLGYRAPFVPGYDNHGMPIENAVTKKFQESHKQVGKIELRKACREHASKFMRVQTEQFKRLGVLGDWDKPYYTMDYQMEAAIVRAFGKLVENGYIYRGLKPVLWCPTDETALADAEIEYREHTSDSIYVKFPLVNDPHNIFSDCSNPHAVIWTTTPWTIPANMAVAVSPELEYCLIAVEQMTLLMVKTRIPAVMEACRLSEYRIIKTVLGADLEGLVFKHPIFDRISPLLVVSHDHKGMSFVTSEDGTGIVHVAPGHGESDFYVGQANGIEVLNPVDGKGFFTEKAGEFAGLHTKKDGRTAVLNRMKELGNLLAHSQYDHQYPHCWRCQTPLMFRATVQWFMNIDHNDHRKKCLDAIDTVRWYPSQGVNRIKAMVENRPDWCLSRQRAWGVGIPAFYCEQCGDPLLTPESVECVAKLIDAKGSDAWFDVHANEILTPDMKCQHCGGSRFTKETDVLDVWFDSGSTHFAVLDHRDELRWPADLYFEGSDQHRGWFNTSLMVAMGMKGKPPYATVVTHGFVVDEAGYKMAKSRGNVLEPIEMCEKYGADVLRLWVASSVYFDDIGISKHILDNCSSMYRDFRNSIRFMLSNLYDYDPGKPVKFDDMLEIDKWALGRLQRVITEANAGYESFEFSKVVQSVNLFITTDLSPFYLDVLKDRLYADKPDSKERRSAQTVFYNIALALTRIMAPILVHTCDEIWKYLPGDKPNSVHLDVMPQCNDLYEDSALNQRWEIIKELRDVAGPQIEAWRQSFKDDAAGAKAKDIAQAMVSIKADSNRYAALSACKEYLSTALKVSKVNLLEGSEGLTIEVSDAPGVKCPRCWLVKEDVGANPEMPELCGRCAKVIAG